MAQLLQRFERKHMVWLVNALVFLFFVTVLTFKKGYSYAPMTLAGIGIIYLLVHIFKFKKPLNFTKEDKWLIFAFLFYFATFAFSAVYHGDGWREIDNPSRVLLFIPLLLLFREFPINIKVLLHGIPIGAGLAGILACYQKFYLNLPRPFPYLMHIQAGDIAISLAMMSLAISIYWGIKKDYKLMIFCLICSGFGVIASALTGARGGWIGLPVILGIILWYSYKNLSKKITVGISLVLTILISGIIFSPQTNVMHRITAAQKEVINYFDKNHKNTSLGARFDMWQSAWLGIKEKPIVGWGSKGYIDLKQQQLKDKIIHKGTLRFNDPHNQFLDAFVKRGMLGIISVIFVVLIPFIIFFHSLRNSSLNISFISLLGVIYIVSSAFFFASQTFLAHNSGSIFYFFLVYALYSIIRLQKL